MDNPESLITSQIITDIIKREYNQDGKRFEYKLKCNGTETEPFMARERVKYRFSLTKRDTTTGIEKIHEFTRRYSHFEWLQIELQTKLLGRIIPSLPQRTQNYDKDKRKLEFVFFMEKILDHKKLQFQDCIEKFFSDELSDFNAFQEYYEKMTESNSIFSKIKNVGNSAFSYITSFFNTGGVTTVPRLPDENDKEFDEYKKNLELNKQNADFIYKDMQKIVNRLQQQSRSLSNSQDIFMNECQGTEQFNKLKSVIKIYEGSEIQLRQKYLYKLETFIKDFDQALDIIQIYKVLKDQINKETQLMNHPSYRAQLDELRLSISNNQQKVKHLYQNFVDDIQIFNNHQQQQLSEILNNFNNELAQFYESIQSLRKL